MNNLNNKNTNKLPMPSKVNKAFRIYSSCLLAVALVMGLSLTAYADGDPIAVINNLSEFIFGLIRASVPTASSPWPVASSSRSQKRS